MPHFIFSGRRIQFNFECIEKLKRRTRQAYSYMTGFAGSYFNPMKVYLLNNVIYLFAPALSSDTVVLITNPP